MEVLESGIIQYVSKELLIASKGSHLYRSYDSGVTWGNWCDLPVPIFATILGKNRWLSRLSRKEIHHLIDVNESYFACFAFGHIYLVDKQKVHIKSIGNIKASRPLKVCSDGERIYYGVYIGNKERKPVNLYSFSLKDGEWSVVYTFNNIRHIHGVFWDEHESKLWITTGDLNYESSIWCFNRDNKPSKIVTGSQQTRAVDLLFTEDAIFYATDAPHDQNYIYRMNRDSSKVKKMQAVGGPVFYGRKEDSWLFFSTVVEPTKSNRTDAVELWGSNDQGYSWQKIKEFPKDIGHMKLFQYGQIKFPSGPGDGKNLWVTPYATDHDHQIIKVRL